MRAMATKTSPEGAQCSSPGRSEAKPWDPRGQTEMSPERATYKLRAVYVALSGLAPASIHVSQGSASLRPGPCCRAPSGLTASLIKHCAPQVGGQNHVCVMTCKLEMHTATPLRVPSGQPCGILWAVASLTMSAPLRAFEKTPAVEVSDGMLILCEPPPEWLRKPVDDIHTLLELPENWDSYGARRIEPHTAAAGVGLLLSIMKRQTPKS